MTIAASAQTQNISISNAQPVKKNASVCSLTASKVAKAAGIILFGIISIIPTLISAVVDGTIDRLPGVMILFTVPLGLKNLFDQTREKFNNQLGNEPTSFGNSLYAITKKWVVWNSANK